MIGKRYIKWEVEDTFFGAILGAFLGTFIQNLPREHIFLVILFFVLFPPVLRKAESISVSAVLIYCIGSVLWILIFASDLVGKNIITFDQGFAIVAIFSGWTLTAIAKAFS